MVEPQFPVISTAEREIQCASKKKEKNLSIKFFIFIFKKATFFAPEVKSGNPYLIRFQSRWHPRIFFQGTSGIVVRMVGWVTRHFSPGRTGFLSGFNCRRRRTGRSCTLHCRTVNRIVQIAARRPGRRRRRPSGPIGGLDQVGGGPSRRHQERVVSIQRWRRNVILIRRRLAVSANFPGRTKIKKTREKLNGSHLLRLTK